MRKKFKLSLLVLIFLGLMALMTLASMAQNNNNAAAAGQGLTTPAAEIKQWRQTK